MKVAKLYMRSEGLARRLWISHGSLSGFASVEYQVQCHRTVRNPGRTVTLQEVRSRLLRGKNFVPGRSLSEAEIQTRMLLTGLRCAPICHEDLA